MPGTRRQTIALLVDLIRTDRPKFLPTLKDLGVSKLPDRQKLRDIINAVANPPVGSEDNLRDEFKEELEMWPYAVVQGEKYIANSDVDTLVNKPPTDRPLRKYRVTVRDPETKVSGLMLRRRRAADSGAANASLPPIADGEVVVGDEESWSVKDPNLCVHVYVPNVVQPSMGYVQVIRATYHTSSSDAAQRMRTRARDACARAEPERAMPILSNSAAAVPPRGRSRSESAWERVGPRGCPHPGVTCVAYHLGAWSRTRKRTLSECARCHAGLGKLRQPHRVGRRRRADAQGAADGRHVANAAQDPCAIATCPAGGGSRTRAHGPTE